VLQEILSSGFYWQWWLRRSGGASQRRGREGGKIEEKWQKKTGQK
jgi:hypothetical protein